MHNASLRLAVGILLLLVVCPAAMARVWTDRQGRTMTGRFVRLKEGQVIIVSGTKPVSVPLENLSDEDQQYVLAQSKGKGQATAAEGTAGNPGGSAGSAGSAAAETPEPFDPNAVRTWTDVRGQKLEAQFVKVEQGRVYLRKDGREMSFSFSKFSPQDQEFVRNIVGDEAELVEPAAPSMSMGSSAPTAPSMPMGPSMPIGPSFPNIRPPGAFPSPGGGNLANDAFRQMDERMAAMREESARRAEEQAAEWERQRMESQQQLAEQTQRMAEPTQGAPAAPPRIGGPGPTTPPQLQEVYYCTKCNKMLTGNVEVGDRCPHCGAYFAYKKDEFGTITDTSTSSVVFSSVCCIGFLVCAAVGFITILVKLFSR